jgi:hypothetical protein
MESHEISLVGGENPIKAVFSVEEENNGYTLRCEYANRTIAAKADDLFDALCEIRRVLAQDNLFPFCYGSSMNVFPSGMSREMSGGLLAYRMEKGKQARTEDIVSIFAAGDDVRVTTVEDQHQFYCNWLASLAS